MREKERKESKHWYLGQVRAYVTKAEKETLSDIFQTSFESHKNRSKTSSYVFIEHVLAKMPHHEAFDDLFDR